MQNTGIGTRQALTHFIASCDEVIGSLGYAENVEMLDAVTSNNSFFGSLVSNYSNLTNNNISASVNALGSRLWQLNAQLQQEGHSLIHGHLNGRNIQQAEWSEHSIIGNFFGGEDYSSDSSHATARQIARTRGQVEGIRDQALGILARVRIIEVPTAPPAYAAQPMPAPYNPAYAAQPMPAPYNPAFVPQAVPAHQAPAAARRGNICGVITVVMSIAIAFFIGRVSSIS